MRYLSVCSGIEAASVAWHPLGWQAAAFSEIEKFPRTVLAERWPNVPIHGDFTTIKGDEYGTIDLLVGGTPCQDFSVAGLRAGIAGERGNLTLEFIRLAARVAPRWIVWENVPGVLSSDGGRALGAFLGGLAELGYGFAYRVLDAQYFGVAQRRARVFVVGYLGDWRRAAAVLFERESLLGHPPPRREAGKEVAPTISARTKGGGGLGTDFECDGGLIADTLTVGANQTYGFCGEITATPIQQPIAMVDGQENAISKTLLAKSGYRIDPETETLIPFDTTQLTSKSNYSNPQSGDPCHPLAAGAHPPAVAFNNTGQGWWNENKIAGTLRDMSAGSGSKESTVVLANPPAVAFEWQRGASQNMEFVKEKAPALIKSQTPAVAFDLRGKEGGAQSGQSGKGDAAPLMAFQTSQSGVRLGEAHPTLDSNNGSRRHHGALVGSIVRRLTPRECERLQGFPDDYTLVNYRGKAAADGPRYKALGNSMAVPVMHWIGKRIAMVEAICAENDKKTGRK